MDELIHQIGLLLSQLRIARRAIEDIERSTAKYNSFAFASALSTGAKFGEPPMIGDALKVWIVNINDLAPGAGGGFLEQLLGGIGRFFGNFGGGAVGSILGSPKLPGMIENIHKIADSVERILIRLGINMNEADKKKDTSKKPEGPSLLDTLAGWKDVFQVFTALFMAAKDPEESQKNVNSLTPGAQQWKSILDSSLAVISAIDRVVRGLTFLIPLAIGALAELITQFDRVKLAIIELMQFFLQELFLLRGVVLVTVFDTLSAVAKLAASILGILSVGLAAIADSIFRIFDNVFQGAISAIRFLADGLQSTIDGVARWLVDVIGAALSVISDSVLFREIVYIVRVLPDLLPHLVVALQGPGALKDLKVSRLDRARTVPLPDLGAKGASGASLPHPAYIASNLLPSDKYEGLENAVTTAINGVQKELKGTFGTATGTLYGMAKQLDDAAKDKDFNNTLQPYIKDLRVNSRTLAEAIGDAQKAALDSATKGHTPTGLEIIAEAYEKWLQNGGLKDVLSYVTDFFKTPGVADVYKDKAVGPTAITQPRATVDIQDMIIEIQAPLEETDSETDHDKKPDHHYADDLLDVVKRYFRDFGQRGERLENTF